MDIFVNRTTKDILTDSYVSLGNEGFNSLKIIRFCTSYFFVVFYEK